MVRPDFRQWHSARHRARPGFQAETQLVVTWDAQRGLDCLRSDTYYHPDGRFSGPIVSRRLTWRGARRWLWRHDRRCLRAIEAFLAEAKEVSPCPQN